MFALFGVFIGIFLAMFVVAVVAAVAVMLFPFVVVAATCAAVGLYCMQAGAILFPDTAYGPSPVRPPRGGAKADPAYQHYLAAQVWRDWRTILRGAAPLISARAGRALRTATRWLLDGKHAVFLFPLWLAVCGGILLAVVPTGIILALIVAVYLVTVAAGMLAWLVCTAVLRAVEQTVMLARRILQTCPYPGCYARFTLPVYSCSRCGARHRNLTPDMNGAVWHVCQCGTRLPTTILLGRYRLPAHCPKCDRHLPARIGRARIEPLPLAGGPDAGKTTFMVLAVDSLHGAVTSAGGSVHFVDKGDEDAFRRLRRELSSGRVSKTLTDLPRAVMLEVNPGKRQGSGRILYLFDTSGEHYTGASGVEAMRYLDHGEALALVIDPFALPEVQDNLLESERRMLNARGVTLSREDPADTFTRLRNELSSRADGGKQRRVAVVLTKGDLLKTTTSGRGAAEDLRGWLILMGMGNLVRELENQGADVRYFASGLPPDAPGLARLFGWLSGLRLYGHATRATATEPTTGTSRRPWDAKARPQGRLPLSYLLCRRAVASITVALSAVTLILLSLSVLDPWLQGGAAPRPAQTPLSFPAVPELTRMPKALTGRWEGPVDQSALLPPHRVTLMIRGGEAHGRVGSVRYRGLKCSGSLTLERGSSADLLIMREEITDDPQGVCGRSRWIALIRRSESRLDYQRFPDPDALFYGRPPEATARLTHEE